MKKKQPISRDEWQQVILGIVDEVDAFCRLNGIRYSLSYGSLLGAIRHKGFIPWDDDMDINMPYPDMVRFKETFQSDRIKYLDVDTEKGYELPFSRVTDIRTYNRKGLFVKDYGINIDLYPVVGCPTDDELVDDFFFVGKTILKERIQRNSQRHRIAKILPFKTFPAHKAVNVRFRDHTLQYPYDGAGRFFHMGGPLEWYEVFDYDMFSELIDVEFEGHTYLATAMYDKYLTQIYGDYMTPPPEEKRHPYHNHKYYWK
ncbi:MAG: LicD family protein [Bacteroidales bacterium]|nr:LicD family protein [Bacteroidales bacterium]